MSYNTYKELPDFVFTEEGSRLLIHGYLSESKQEGHDLGVKKVAYHQANHALELLCANVSEKEMSQFLLNWLSLVPNYPRQTTASQMSNPLKF